MDAGLYTCVARNQFGVASSAGSLLVKGKVLFSWLQTSALVGFLLIDIACVLFILSPLAVSMVTSALLLYIQKII